MITLVGTQTNFKDALKELNELKHDLIESYKEAIKRVTNEKYKEKLNKFLEEHQEDVDQIMEVLGNHDENASDESSMINSKIAKGKVMIADLIDDKTILRAINSNEDDNHKAFERMRDHSEKWDDAEDLIKNGLEKAQNHKKWLDSTIRA